MSAEHFQRWSDVVPDLQSAWLFVMDHLGDIEDPRIEISPIWIYEDDGSTPLKFEVSVGWSSKRPNVAPPPEVEP